jgi:hypothetical protein
MKNQLLIRIDRRLVLLKDFAAARFVLYLLIALGTALVSTPARGTDHNGTPLLNFTVAIAGSVAIRSHGYADETPSTGPESQSIAFEAPALFAFVPFARKGSGLHP